MEFVGFSPTEEELCMVDWSTIPRIQANYMWLLLHMNNSLVPFTQYLPNLTFMLSLLSVSQAQHTRLEGSGFSQIPCLHICNALGLQGCSPFADSNT